MTPPTAAAQTPEGLSQPQVLISSPQTFPRKLATLGLLLLADLLGWGVSLALAAGATHLLIPTPSLWWVPLLGLAFFAVEGLYTQRRAFWDEVRSLWRATALTQLAALPTFLALHLSPALWALGGAIGLVLLPFVRRGTKGALPRLGLWRKRVLVVGAGPCARRVLGAISRDPVLGYEVAGCLDDEAPERPEADPVGGSGAPVLGPLAHLEETIAATGSQDVWLALPDLPEARWPELVSRLQGNRRVEGVRVVPGLEYLSLMQVRLDPFLPERLFTITLADNLEKPWNRWLKRAIDLVAGAALLLVALPWWGLIAWLVRRDSPGPALYVHDRLGQGGRTFRCYKFRTMYLDGDRRLKRSIAEDERVRREWEVFRKLKLNDPRITPVGRVLRRWSLDELPQLWNVLQGKMSLVGPRPYLPEERALAGAELEVVCQARPGLTGLWQVSGKNAIPFHERVQIEAWYVRNWSLWLDLVIVLRTVRAVWQEEGEY